MPPAGSVIGAGDTTVCDECPRKRNEKTIKKFRRMATFQPNPTDCLLEQGILCAGWPPAAGCGALPQRQHAVHRLLRPRTRACSTTARG